MNIRRGQEQDTYYLFHGNVHCANDEAQCEEYCDDEYHPYGES